MAYYNPVPKSVVNMLYNVAGGWGANFRPAPQHVSALLEQSIDDALYPVHMQRTDEERRRDEERILIQKQRYEEEQRLIAEERNYQKQIEAHRPVVDHEEALSRMEKRGRELALQMTEIAEKGMCLSVALGYVGQMLQGDYGLDTTKENTMPRDRILALGRNISVIPMVRLLAKYFDLSPEDTESFVHNEMGRIYNQQPQPLRRDMPAPQRQYAPGGALMGDPQPRHQPVTKPDRAGKSPFTPNGKKKKNSEAIENVIQLLQGLQ